MTIVFIVLIVLGIVGLWSGSSKPANRNNNYTDDLD